MWKILLLCIKLCNYNILRKSLVLVFVSALLSFVNFQCGALFAGIQNPLNTDCYDAEMDYVCRLTSSGYETCKFQEHMSGNNWSFCKKNYRRSATECVECASFVGNSTCADKSCQKWYSAKIF